jgi:hypothetical protein
MGNGQSLVVLRKTPPIDWGQLSTAAAEALEGLENGGLQWRTTPQSIRLELVQTVLAQPTKSGGPMMMMEFDKVRPAWMGQSQALVKMFSCKWRELPGLRLGG